jgi:hypothetical protein
MSNDRLVAELGSEPRTPIDEAVRASLSSLGCLPAVTPRGASPALRPGVSL